MSNIYMFERNDAESVTANTAPFALAFYIRGNDWAERGEFDRALVDYDAALRMDPLFIEAFVNRGVVWARKGDLDRAIADYDAALRLNPRDGKAIRNRSLALEQQCNPRRETGSKNN
jgi:tetratricopeptide (TPR) repeat protein